MLKQHVTMLYSINDLFIYLLPGGLLNYKQKHYHTTILENKLIEAGKYIEYE